MGLLQVTALLISILVSRSARIRGVANAQKAKRSKETGLAWDAIDFSLSQVSRVISLPVALRSLLTITLRTPT